MPLSDTCPGRTNPHRRCCGENPRFDLKGVRSTQSEEPPAGILIHSHPTMCCSVGWSTIPSLTPKKCKSLCSEWVISRRKSKAALGLPGCDFKSDPSDGKHTSAPLQRYVDLLLKECERRFPAYGIRPSRTTSRSDPILPRIILPPKRPPKRRFRSKVLPPLRLPVLWPKWTLLPPRQQQQHLRLWASFLSFLLLSSMRPSTVSDEKPSMLYPFWQTRIARSVSQGKVVVVLLLPFPTNTRQTSTTPKIAR